MNREMQLGYSLLLQEFVTATEVDYGDCATFQIVCPNCREAIFKAGELSGARQYLSHYAASKSDVKECELRVGRFSIDQIRSANVQGRAQTLEAFFSSFQMSVLDWWCPDDAERTRKQMNWMVSRPSFMLYASYVATNFRLNDLDKLWEDIFADLTSGQSEYWIAQQKRFSLDFLQHLLAPNSKSAWYFICALSIFINRVIHDDMRRDLLYGNEIRLKRMLTKLRNTLIPLDEKPPGVTLHGHSTYSYSHLLGFRIVRTVLYLLLCIPYTDLLAGTKSKAFVHNREFLEELAHK